MFRLPKGKPAFPGRNDKTICVHTGWPFGNGICYNFLAKSRDLVQDPDWRVDISMHTVRHFLHPDAAASAKTG